jgi:hypothetical protein
MGYYLADGIYPDWPVFVKTIRNPYDVRTQHFATIQESARKDIERAFGVLQKRWAIVFVEKLPTTKFYNFSRSTKFILVVWSFVHLT